jgi:hypothetical protein
MMIRGLLYVKNVSHIIFINYYYLYLMVLLVHSQCSIPFSLDDITKTLPVIEMADDDLLPFVHENPSFAFLLQRGE